MNAFHEHHKGSIQFSYRCFDRILLNGLIQPFQQPERVLGFFNTYREGRRVTRKTLTEISDQFQYWVKKRSEKWGAPILDPPAGRRERQPAGSVAGCVFPRGQTQPSGGDPESAGASAHPGSHRKQRQRQSPSGVQTAVDKPVQLLRERCALGPHVRAHVSLLSLFRAGVPQPTSLAGASDERRRHQFSAEHKCIPEMQQSGAATRTG